MLTKKGRQAEREYMEETFGTVQAPGTLSIPEGAAAGEYRIIEKADGELNVFYQELWKGDELIATTHPNSLK